MNKITAQDLFRYHLVFRNVFKDILRPDKTPISEFEILMVVHDRKGIKIGELSEAMSITRPNLTPLVDTLERKHQIVRKQDEIDKRVTRLYITEEGVQRLEDVFNAIDARYAVFKEKYTEQELKRTKDYCDKLVKILDK